MSNNKKAGPITLAIGLIFFGGVLLAANFAGLGILETALKFYPVLLIGLGLEYFIKSFIYRNDENQDGQVRFHFPTVFIILLVAFIGFTSHQAMTFLQNKDLDRFIDEAIGGANFNYRQVIKSTPVEVKPGITKLKLNNLQGKIEVLPSIDGKIHVETKVLAWGPSQAEAMKRAQQVKVEISEGDLVDISCDVIQNYNNKRSKDVSFRIAVPKAVDVYLEDEFGTLRVDKLEANLNIRDANGELYLTEIKGNVFLEGESGRVTLDKIEGTLEARMNSGDIKVNNISGDVQLRNEHGLIEVASTQPVSANYTISNRSGEIICRLPESSNATVLASTQTGSITGSLNLKLEDRAAEQGPGAKGSLVLGAGQGKINLTNEHGSIIVDSN